MIEEGMRIPAMSVHRMSVTGPESIDTIDLLTDRRAVLFGLPGAFTPTCTAHHLPGYVDAVKEIKAEGINLIACVATNDIFVLDAWGKALNAHSVMMLADGNCDLTTAMGMATDASDYGMGCRSRRYSMYVEDGTLRKLFLEDEKSCSSMGERIGGGEMADIPDMGEPSEASANLMEIGQTSAGHMLEYLRSRSR